MATVTRVLGVVFGAFFLLISVPMMIGGAAVLAIPAVIADDQGYMNAPTIHVQNDNAYAYVSESFKLENNESTTQSSDNGVNYQFDNYGKIVNFRVMADSYFVGLAPTAEVQSYLKDVPYEVVSQMNNQDITTYSVNAGKNGSLAGPLEQSFWIASGTDVLYYTPSASDFNKQLTLVVMKTDASQGINSDVKIGVNVPILQPIGIILLVIGGIFFVLTVTLFVVAYKSKDTPREVRYYTVPGQVQVKTPSLDQQTTPTKYCKNCGTQSEVFANFCETCGFEYRTD